MSPSQASTHSPSSPKMMASPTIRNQGSGIEEAAAESEAAAAGGHQAPHGHHPGGPHGGLPGQPGHPAGQAGQGHPGHHGHSHEEEDSGCECGLEELEGMDTWTKTMVAIKVLTAFKKRRKKKKEAEEKEKIAKEKRKNLWRRLGFKLRVFNMFARKIESDDPSKERLLKLKRKLGDLTLECEEDAERYQLKIEESLQYRLEFQLRPGDIILTHFDTLPSHRQGKKERRASKVFQRTHSFDDSNPRAARKGRSATSSLRGSLLDLDLASRRRSWHSEELSSLFLDFGARGKTGHVAPIVIVTQPVVESRKPGRELLDPPYRHYIHEKKKERRPSIVSRNFRKMFGK